MLHSMSRCSDGLLAGSQLGDSRPMGRENGIAVFSPVPRENSVLTDFIGFSSS
jgi:hypothetical protein